MGSGNRTFGRLTGAALGHVLVAMLAFALLLVAAGPLRANCDPGQVRIKGDFGEARFSVEVADTDAARAKGLMHRETLPMSAGMLFVYDRPQPLSFWMRNTPLPLDILFFGPDGTLRQLHSMAQPFDETPIFGGMGLTHVLEINGGLAGRLGIAAGAVLQHPTFSQISAAWPC
jgi:uncharacterized membrane protein (UPF0127 family)